MVISEGDAEEKGIISVSRDTIPLQQKAVLKRSGSLRLGEN
jgi:hypothetical protein